VWITAERGAIKERRAPGPARIRRPVRDSASLPSQAHHGRVPGMSFSDQS
jgi:hypothetical protein